MCRHNCFFYGLLAKHNIVSLLVDCCSDGDNHTRNSACFAIGNVAYHNDFFYEELRRCIPKLANLLLSEEELDRTKINASGALSNLVRHSNKFCHDMVSKGAMLALLKLVEDHSVVAPNSSWCESPPKVALLALDKMCVHTSFRQFVRASDQYSLIETLCESEDEMIAKHASNIIKRTSQS
ncbi:hypothetical protein QVD17_20134 [Tagetes erecta]|uniref:non-specific serine/threonine protein kinase n=1 Tax=Tagetes erecta TaxID=13708 RepID=A0AAD8KPE2_TARER|nr:hypothetical protein QVD17_20134 [Tagetes erecta]